MSRATEDLRVVNTDMVQGRISGIGTLFHREARTRLGLQCDYFGRNLPIVAHSIRSWYLLNIMVSLDGLDYLAAIPDKLKVNDTLKIRAS